METKNKLEFLKSKTPNHAFSKIPTPTPHISPLYVALEPTFIRTNGQHDMYVGKYGTLHDRVSF